jgi:CHRD domain
MKKLFVLLVAGTVSAHAALIHFSLSPPGTDAAVGLSPSNEVPVVTNSTGSGNTIGNGIVFDTATSVLHVDVGYGSAAGFTDLTGVPTAMHIHSPAPPGQEAGVLIDLMPYNQPASNAATGGTIVGDIPYPPDSVSNLLAGLNYLNIHTATNSGGEIRGQLIQGPSLPPSVTCQGDSTVECGTSATITAVASTPDAIALTVVWTINGTGVQTNTIAEGSPPEGTNISFSSVLPLGTNAVVITVSDASSNSASCMTVITVVDTTPPVIGSVDATPNVLWPPNHKMRSVRVQAQVTDACGPATWKIISVSSNEEDKGKGKGHKETDWKITGDHTLNLRAARDGKGQGRVYTITIEATDLSGNTSRSTVTVTVPHDKGKGKDKKPGKGNDGSANPGQGNNGAGNPGKGNSGSANPGQGNNGAGNPGRGNSGAEHGNSGRP